MKLQEDYASEKEIEREREREKERKKEEEGMCMQYRSHE